ncbi:alpha-L-fucosidase [Thalassotalea fonticola]|uniref:alpha-L-fucosidase n=1 Tax=Thalassotalea fonticola TaxID=3065649 RepID=A0ABZ0GQT3_9GAMM|nr:alpha-L-fucosidase [Colwelliaceae bacterium S1-1]
MKNIIKNTIFSTMIVLVLQSCSSDQNKPRLQQVAFTQPVERDHWIPTDQETEKERNERMAWWREAKFGLFIHWGVYSVPGGEYQGKPASAEWIMLRSQIPVDDYKDYAKDFNPVDYDPEKWVLAAKDAGMKYIVITAKHHDGFALYDSKVTDWDVVDASEYGKDLLRPLAEAARKHGMKLGFYYSQAQDWVHPGGAKHKNVQWDAQQAGSYDQYIEQVAAPQVKEILSEYGDIAILWWDTPVGVRASHVEQFNLGLALQPGIITNNRLGGGALGDTITPEQFIPALGIPGFDWETCMTMNNSWGYRTNDDNWKSAEELIRKLGDIVSKGGNFLLNVGPTPSGEIPATSMQLLSQIGDWMTVNGEAIYATEQSVFSFLDWGRVTQRTLENGNTRLYLHVWHWPENGRLSLPLKNKVVDSFLLAEQKAIATVDNKQTKEFVLPTQAPDDISTIIVVDIEGAPQLSENRFNKAQLDGQFIFDTNRAMLHNHLGSHMVVDETGAEAKIIDWRAKPGRRAEGWIEWEFEVAQAGQYTLSSRISAASKASKSMQAVIEYLGEDSDSLKVVYNKRGKIIKPVGQSLTVIINSDEEQAHSLLLGKLSIGKPGVYRLGLLPLEQQEKTSTSTDGMGLVNDGTGWVGPDVHQVSLTPVPLKNRP